MGIRSLQKTDPRSIPKTLYSADDDNFERATVVEHSPWFAIASSSYLTARRRLESVTKNGDVLRAERQNLLIVVVVSCLVICIGYTEILRLARDTTCENRLGKRSKERTTQMRLRRRRAEKPVTDSQDIV